MTGVGVAIPCRHLGPALGPRMGLAHDRTLLSVVKGGPRDGAPTLAGPLGRSAVVEGPRGVASAGRAGDRDLHAQGDDDHPARHALARPGRGGPSGHHAPPRLPRRTASAASRLAGAALSPRHADAPRGALIRVPGPRSSLGAAWASLGDALAPILRRGPDFLVVGAQKAGTTSLHHYLSQHPRLQPGAGPKELHYFDLRRQFGPGWYRSHFPRRGTARGRLCFEATPDYLGHAAVPGRIRHELGRVKLIAVLREPADRAHSSWRMWHSFKDRPDRAHRADPRSFAEAIEDEMASPARAAAGIYHYVGMGRYDEHLAAWREHFPDEDMLVLDYGQMGTDLRGFLDRICRFLEVDPFEPEAVEAMSGQRRWVGPEWSVTPSETAALARLRAHYAPANERLFDILGRRFEWRGAPGPIASVPPGGPGASWRPPS